MLARKRKDLLQQVPLGVTAISGADLAARGIQAAADLAARVPMLGFQESVGAPTTTLRIRRIGKGVAIHVEHHAIAAIADRVGRHLQIGLTCALQLCAQHVWLGDKKSVGVSI